MDNLLVCDFILHYILCLIWQKPEGHYTNMGHVRKYYIEFLSVPSLDLKVSTVEDTTVSYPCSNLYGFIRSWNNCTLQQLANNHSTHLECTWTLCLYLRKKSRLNRC